MFSKKLYTSFFMLILSGSLAHCMEFTKSEVKKGLFSAICDEAQFEIYRKEHNVDLTDYIAASDRKVNSLLILAAQYNNLAATSMLLDVGYPVDHRNDNEETALILASRNGHHEIVQLLLERGSDINAQDWDGGTPLMGAALNGDEAMVAFLLLQGARTDLRTTLTSETALDLTIRHSLENIVLIFSAFGITASVTENVQNSVPQGSTMLIDVDEESETFEYDPLLLPDLSDHEEALTDDGSDKEFSVSAAFWQTNYDSGDDLQSESDRYFTYSPYDNGSQDNDELAYMHITMPTTFYAQ